jgi:hypothetical protein
MEQIKKTEVNEQIVSNLNYLLKTYDRVTKLMVQTSNCYFALRPGEDVSLKKEYTELNKAKDSLISQIRKELKNWDIWNKWLEKVPGVGAYIGGNLIIKYYYKFQPICVKCGADMVFGEKETDETTGNTHQPFTCSGCGAPAKGEGGLKHRIIPRTFPTISKWQKFMGRGIDPVDGKLPKRKKNQQANWSAKGRQVTWAFYDQINRQPPSNFYKAYLLERRNYRLTTHPKASKGHNLYMAGNETARLFLSHFWHVAREIAGLPTESPWIIAHGGHEHIIYPYYWTDPATAAPAPAPTRGKQSKKPVTPKRSRKQAPVLAEA